MSNRRPEHEKIVAQAANRPVEADQGRIPGACPVCGDYPPFAVQSIFDKWLGENRGLLAESFNKSRLLRT